MSNDQLYQQCCGAARGLLLALQARDLALIGRKAAEMRARLRCRDTVGPDAPWRKTSLRQEQWEALEAALEGIERSLASLRQTAQAELSRMDASRALLTHLAIGESLAESQSFRNSC